MSGPAMFISLLGALAWTALAQSNGSVCPTTGAVSVLESRYDPHRTGANLCERTLSPDALKRGKFGKLFRYKVDGAVFAHPLIVGGLDISGSKNKNVLFIATMRNQPPVRVRCRFERWRQSRQVLGHRPQLPQLESSRTEVRPNSRFRSLLSSRLQRGQTSI
jgi:hypothetical protein